MSSSSSDPNVIQAKQIQNTLVTVQRLTLKAFNAQNLQNLIFIILNDTFQVLNYDRAILFKMHANKAEILGVSGQSNFGAQTELSTRLKGAVQNLNERSVQRVLKSEDFSSSFDWKHIQLLKPSIVYWVPIKTNHEELGLWLENYDVQGASQIFQTFAPVIKDMIVPAYAISWEKVKHPPLRKLSSFFTLRNFGIFSLALLTLLFIIPIRLRIVAPCEVIPKESFVVTSSLDGIIDKIIVKPGQEVEKNQILYEYDKKIPSFKYQAALKEVEILQAEVNQAYALGIESDTEASKLALLNTKLQKSKVELAYVKQQIDLLIEKSPIKGLVSVDNPDDWRGRPVKIGEKIMTINNQAQSKLRIWIPERDNIVFAFDIPIRIFLNSIPTKTFEAKFLFITPEVKVSQGELPGFEAEAEWLNTEETPKLGLKGSAVIYGERVSVFYYLFRKPIGALRNFIGV